MTDTDDLHIRLDAIGARIDARRAHLKEIGDWNDGHHLTSGELRARYLYLKRKLDEEIRDREAHGHHVTGLEASVMGWINSLAR